MSLPRGKDTDAKNKAGSQKPTHGSWHFPGRVFVATKTPGMEVDGD